jgi:hypothetical protein
MSARPICMSCGGPLPGGGLCATCDTLSDLEAAAKCATCSTLALSRLAYLGLKLREAIAASNDNPVVLDRGPALVLQRLLADAEFEADAALEAECDRALSTRVLP